MSKRIWRFSPVRHRRTVFIVAGIMFTCAVGVFAYFFILRENPETKLYKTKAGQLAERIEEGTKTIYIAERYIPAGEVLIPEMTVETRLLTESSSYITDEDFGKKVVTDIGKGTELTKSLLLSAEENVILKEIEYDNVSISRNISDGDYADIRIRYPNGSDFIVLAKKQIGGYDGLGKSMTVMVDEKEILMMDSAGVDADIYGGTFLYLAKYTDPSHEQPAEVNYIPSLVTCEMINRNSGIVDGFSVEEIEQREMLENSLKGFITPDGIKTGQGKKTGNETSYDKGGSIWD